MADVSETKYAELFTRYREASMLADKYELIAKTKQGINESLRETNDDLRRMLLEKDKQNDELRVLVARFRESMGNCGAYSYDCRQCPQWYQELGEDDGWCALEMDADRVLRIEVDE